MRILIVGAGIGGLTTALALHHMGFDDVVVLEGAREIRPLGVGINVLPHAVRELTALGLGDALSDAGVELADLSYYTQHGSSVWSEPRGKRAGYLWPQYSLLRGQLQMLLLDAVHDRLGAASVQTGKQVSSVRTEGDVVRVTWVGESGGGEELGAVAVGADGIRSAVRAERYPDEGPPVWNGAILWRGTSRVEPFLTGRSMIMAGNASTKFVVYPISGPDQDGLELVNWIAERRVDTTDAGEQDWNRQVSPDVFAHHFAKWRFDWLDIPQVIARAETVYEYPMVDRPPLDTWIDGRAVLLGDAAHPTYPIGSNGSSQAIVDARVLAFALATHPVREALQFYENERLPRTRELQRINREMGPERVMQIAHERAPEGFTHIDDVVPREERERIAANYKMVAGFDPHVLNALPPWERPA